MAEVEAVVYWDTSAVLSLLFEDAHSTLAVSEMRGKRVHLMPSLTWTETHFVIERMRRTRAVAR